METKAHPVEQRSDRELVATRFFDAPREMVYAAWTDPERIAQWWGPNAYTTTIHEMDARPGGVWRFTMHSPDGTDYANRIDFTNVVEPERLTYAHGDDERTYFHVAVTFSEEHAGTRMTFRTICSSAEERDRLVECGAVECGNQTFNRLAEYLSKKAGETRQ